MTRRKRWSPEEPIVHVEHRPLCDVAAEVLEHTWAKTLPVVRDTLDATPQQRASASLARLATIRGLTEVVGLETGEELVAIFLQNSGTWQDRSQDQTVRRLNNARIAALKRELFAMLSQRMFRKYWPDASDRKTIIEIFCGRPLRPQDVAKPVTRDKKRIPKGERKNIS